ncbi:sensor histidine kinase [Clostridium sp. YIM B02551]|uniref:sensor histidine kinase n=1 Tax=Clostridium sp. YIM B02551 TaxID=2910679 RepID=UPI001EEB1550|nr:sensor histidine kinase [Clostridium sp. YIM B02551]
MRNKFKSVFTPYTDEGVFSKSPIIVSVILLYLATVFVQNSGEMTKNETAGFTIVIVIQLLVYLFSVNIFKKKHWLYFIIQGIITFDYAVIAPEGYKTILLGLIPLFIIQSMIVYSDAAKVIATAIFFYSIYCGTIIVLSGMDVLIQSLPLLVIISIAMRAYAMIFFKQVKLRIQAQRISKELEMAYEKVEELTLVNERQRMARDLHDTLSQGLAGVIMQLDAVNANLSKNNTERAKEIVQKAMEHARKTLADSRLVIDDLRSQTKIEMDFIKAIEEEITQFGNVSNTFVKDDIRIESLIPENISRHILFIVREALNNISKHAAANNVSITIMEVKNQINININDDGVGFDVKLLDKLFGHYGILGMTERVKAIHGKIKIKSKRKYGTDINIIIPIEKGIDEDNG